MVGIIFLFHKTRKLFHNREQCHADLPGLHAISLPPNKIMLFGRFFNFERFSDFI